MPLIAELLGLAVCHIRCQIRLSICAPGDLLVLISSALQLEEAAKVEAKRQEIAGRLAAMALEVEAAAARRLADAEAATQRRNAAKAAAASGAPHPAATEEPQADADDDMAAEGEDALYDLCMQLLHVKHNCCPLS